MADFTPRFDTLIDILEHSSAAFADRPLFGEKHQGSWSWMTYRGFREEVDRVRTGLAGLGTTKGDAVALIADNRSEWAIAAYAAYGLGAAVVPMYQAQSVDNWQYIINDSGATVLFVATPGIKRRILEVADTLTQLQHIICFEADGDEPWFGSLGAEADDITPRTAVDPDDIAGFVYTSGTTGRPKGVLLSHGNLAHNVSAITSVFPLQPSDRTLSFLPWAHAFGQTVELHCLVAVGGSTAFAESTTQIVPNLGEVKPTMLVSVPRIFTRIYDGLQKRMEEEGGVTKMMFDAAMRNAHKRQEAAAEGRTSGWLDLQHAMFDRLVFARVREQFGGNLKYAISGGAAIPLEVARFIDALGITVYEGYGLSETSPIATANWPGSRLIGSVGKPIPGVRIEIDRTGSADPQGGEIVVYGHNVMQGYHNLPDANEEAFTADGGFRTGDLGRIDDDGFLHIIGRVKEQYKLANGKYVVPTIIEEKIGLSPYIANAMVYGDNRPFNVALIALDMDATAAWAAAKGLHVTGDELVNHPDVLALIGEEIDRQTSGIARYERIREFTLLSEDFTTENGMLTPTLKLKRPVVLDRFKDDVEQLYA